jgi:hypothetical protein
MTVARHASIATSARMAGMLGKIIVVAAALVATACGSDKPPAPPVDHLLGRWCMQSEAASADGPRVLGGSKWEMRSDGTYGYAFKWHLWDESWSRNGSALNLGKLGVHHIVKLDAATMELRQGKAHKYFGRDCGPNYAKAELVHALVDAAAEAQPEKVEEVLGRGANIDGIDLLGVLEQTALIAAVRAHDVPMVKLLLERGARHDIATSEGITAMNAAELAGYLDIVELLLKAGARPSTRMAPPRKPTAAELEEVRVRKLLDLQPGALINQDAPPPVRPPALAAAGGAPPPAAEPEPGAQPEPAPKAGKPGKKEEPKPEDKEIDALKKELCAKRPANLNAPLSEDMIEMLKSIGVSPGEYIAQQKAIYDQACK